MLIRHFLGGRDGGEGDEGGGSPPNIAELETRLEGMVREARAACPGVEVSPETFARRVGEIARDGVTLDAIHAADLWLALGCLAHDARAVAALERDVIARVRPAVERVSGKGISADDMLQSTREKLLVAADGATPKLAQYTGKGPLVGWVRVVAVREALYAQRNKRHDGPVDDAVLLATPDGGAIELEVLRARHAEAFRAAVQEALRRLTSEQRALLRYHTRDGLTIDQLAPMLGVHRATAARRLEKARTDALEHTRAILREKAGLSESEAKSLCVALANEVDVSIGRALAETAR